MEQLLFRRLFDCVVMVDRPGHPDSLWPRCNNIKYQLAKLVHDARPGDRLVVCFSGHVKQLPTLDPGEEDGQDEYLMAADWEFGGLISDDYLHRHLVSKLPRGVKLLMIADSCSSGTILDLRHNWVLENGMICIPHSFPPISPVEVVLNKLGVAATLTARSQVLCFSASRDGTPAYETQKTSYITHLLAAFARDNDISIGALFQIIDHRLRHRLHGRVPAMQQPQMSSNDLFLNLHARFADFL
ncbi:hypothetical protein AURDEDRAFT_111829 [Auricularia subglabra TFB-10046 SS5]|nr:hypothetical protein AURDEDRAFT_111829 [Auricularia subglabra TFB-10046 SS5]